MMFGTQNNKDENLETEIKENKDGNEISKNKESLCLDDNNILKTFKRCSMGIVSEVKKRQSFVKPSVKRKLKNEAAKRRRSRQNYKRRDNT